MRELLHEYILVFSPYKDILLIFIFICLHCLLKIDEHSVQRVLYIKHFLGPCVVLASMVDWSNVPLMSCLNFLFVLIIIL
jgi:hypothetical protein